MTTVTGIKCGRCKNYHPTIADVRNCGRTADIPEVDIVHDAQLPGFAANPATPKQVSFISRLAANKDWAGREDNDSIATDTIMNVIDGKQISKSEAGKAIDFLLKCGDTKHEPLSAGMYKSHDGTIYRVYLGQNSGQMLAKKIVAKDDDSDGHDRIKYSLQYAGRADRFVEPSQRMSLEDAKGWGQATGTCCVCARRLDVPESVDAGIGPVCAGRMETDNWDD